MPWTDIDEPESGDLATSAWAQSVAQAFNQQGFLPYQYPIGMAIPVTTGAATTLTAVSASLGGAVAVPFNLPGIMSLQSYTLRQASTANARTAECRLYRDVGTSTLEHINGSGATFSFTPAAEDDRTASAAGAPVLLGPGMYWLVIRNTSTSQTFVLGRQDPSELTAVGWGLQLTTASVAALDTTLDVSGWSASTSGVVAVRLNGRVAGRTTALT